MDLGFNRLRQSIMRGLGNMGFTNKFNQAFLWGIGGGDATYDPLMGNYIHKGYNVNPIVYSVIQQMAVKQSTVPVYVREIADKNALKQLNILRKAAGPDPSIAQRVKMLKLETKAFKDGDKPFPMERPNPNQTWEEFDQLMKTFLRCTGNIYLYMLRVEEGRNQGKPMAIYVLPSHQIKIVIKDNADFLGIENPIKEYMLISGNQTARFDVEDVIHIKYSNPNYDESGEHLYGFAPLRVALKNIESSNSGLDLNIKTLKSGGAFGFIHGKTMPITEKQAKALKERLVEMNNSPENLGKIAGTSAEMGFTRISLTSDELRPFDYLKMDQKQICNVLGWSDALLNNDDGGKYDKQLQERKRVVTDNIVPDLILITNAMNNKFLPLFKGYENHRLEFDVMELPEMQDDAAEMAKWLYEGLDRSVFNREEIRKALRFPESEDPDLEVFTVAQDVIPLSEAVRNDFE